MRLGHIVLSVAAMATLFGCVDRNAQKQAKRTEEILNDRTVVVTFTPAKMTAVQDKLEITGTVTTSEDSTVGSKIAGRIVAMNVRDGDPVSAGQVIAQIDSASIMAQLRQAEGQLASARAQLSQAIANAKIGPERSTSAVKVAEAQLRSAKAQLDKARRGARSEELRQAQIQVDAARSSMETARKERDRQKTLYEQGATSLQRYEAAENQYQQALAGYDSALELLRIRQSQTQPEDLRTAEEAVRQAEENLRNAKAQKALDVNLDQQVLAARAQVSSAQAQVDIARTNLADTMIRAPFSGRISGKPIQLGAVVGPGTAVCRLIGGDGVYFEGEIPEMEVSNVQAGRSVIVSMSALAGQTFSGRVIAVNPQGESLGRIFRVRIALDSVTEEVKPGMFARGEIVLQSIPDAVMVPSSAILSSNGEKYLFVLEGEVAKKRVVTPGVVQGDLTQVSGVRGGEKVIDKGQNQVKDGDKVRLETAASEPAGEEKGGA